MTSDRLRTWLGIQPGFTTYDEVVEFLKDLYGTTRAEAELKLAEYVNSDEVKLIQTKRTKRPQKRVFLRPLETLTEEHIRAIWDGSPHSEMELEAIVKGVHDRTGHDVERVKQFISDLDSAKIVGGDTFQWRQRPR